MEGDEHEDWEGQQLSDRPPNMFLNNKQSEHRIIHSGRRGNVKMVKTGSKLDAHLAWELKVHPSTRLTGDS